MLEYKISKKDSIAIIPARAGSKRLPGKNVKLFYGKSIIYYAIKKAEESGLFSKILVTTDSKKIANISKKFGASVEFIRPKYLSNDKVGTIEVISHAVNYLKKKNFLYNYVCCIYPVAPLINLKKFRNCYEILRNSKFNYVFPVSKYRKTNNTYLLLNKNLTIKKKTNKTSCKKLITHYNDSGQYYWGTFSSWLKKKNLFTSKTKVIFLSKNEFVDVNTLEDWKNLKHLYKKFF